MATGPRRVRTYPAPAHNCRGRVLRRRLRPSPGRSRACTVIPRCSSSRSPTCGLSTRGSTPARVSTTGSPMPERSSSWGLSIDPAARITSRRARTASRSPQRLATTPTARPPSSVTWPTWVRSSTVRLRRRRAGRRNAVAAEIRTPRWIVTGVRPIRSASEALKSSTSASPAAVADRSIAATTGSATAVTDTCNGPPTPRSSEAPSSWSSMARNTGSMPAHPHPGSPAAASRS